MSWRVVLWLTIAVVLGGGLWLAAERAREQLLVRWIEVEGEFARVDPEQLRALAAPMVSQPFYELDLAALAVRLEALPWVAEVEIDRRWPDGLYIRVREHEALARFVDERLVSARGALFAVPGGAQMQGLPLFEGDVAAVPELVARYRRFSELLARTGLLIEQLRRSDRGGWFLGLNDGLEVRLGREQVEERLARFIAVYPRLGIGPGRVLERVDLRYGTGFAVKWRADSKRDALELFIEDLQT